MQTLSLVVKKVAKLHFIHGVIFEAAFWDGALAAPSLITDIEGRWLGTAPCACVADEPVQVCKGGIGLYLEFKDKVFDIGADDGNGV